MTISYYLFYLKRIQRGRQPPNFSKKNWKKREKFFNVVLFQNNIEKIWNCKILELEKHLQMKDSNFNISKFHLSENEIKIQRNIFQEKCQIFDKLWKSKIKENNYEKENFFQFFVYFLRPHFFQEKFETFSRIFSKILKYEIKRITEYNFFFFQRNVFQSISILKVISPSFFNFRKMKNQLCCLIQKKEKYLGFCQFQKIKNGKSQNCQETENKEKLFSFNKLKTHFLIENNFSFFHFFHTFFKQLKNKEWNSINFLSLEKNFTKKNGKIFHSFFQKFHYGRIFKYFQNSPLFQRFLENQEFLKFQKIGKYKTFFSLLEDFQMSNLVFFEKTTKNFFLQFFYEKICFFSLFSRNFQKLKKENSVHFDFSHRYSGFKFQNNALEFKKNLSCFFRTKKSNQYQYFNNHFFHLYSKNEKKFFFFSSNEISQCSKKKLIRKIFDVKSFQLFVTFREDFFEFQKKNFFVVSPNTNKKKGKKWHSFQLFENQREKNTNSQIYYFQNWSLPLFFISSFLSSLKISSEICFFHSILCFFLSLNLQPFQKKMFFQNFFEFLQSIGKSFFPFILENNFFNLKRKTLLCSWSSSHKIYEICKKSGIYHIRVDQQKKLECLWSNFSKLQNLAQIFVSVSWKNCQNRTSLDKFYEKNIFLKNFFSKKEKIFFRFFENFLSFSELCTFCENFIKERKKNGISRQKSLFFDLSPNSIFFDEFEKKIFHFEKIVKFRQKKKILENKYFLYLFNSQIQKMEFQKEDERLVFLNLKNFLYNYFSTNCLNVHSDFLFFQKGKNFCRISEIFWKDRIFTKNVSIFFNFYKLFLSFDIFSSFKVLLNTQKNFLFIKNKKYNRNRETVFHSLQNHSFCIQEKNFVSLNSLNYKKNVWLIPEKVAFSPSKKGSHIFYTISVMFAFFFLTISHNSFFLKKYVFERKSKWFIYSVSRQFETKKRKKRESERKEKVQFFGITFSPFFLLSAKKCGEMLKNSFFFKKKPTRERIFSHLRECKQCLKKAIGQKQFHFMKLLQQLIQTWCMKYIGLGTKEVFAYCDSMVLKFLWNWAKKTHPNKSKYWIRKKYFHQISSKKWCFGKKCGKNFLFLRFHSFFQFFPESWKTRIRKKTQIFTRTFGNFTKIQGFYYFIS